MDVSAAAPRRFSGWVLLAGALLIPCVYLPTLGTRFDFIDDGNLVYPAPPMPLGQRLGLVWAKVVANYEHLGPFRPTLWAHWELTAELCQGDALRWRLLRWLWSGVATAALLALLRELRMNAWAALAATALAMWNPYRNEIWTSLTLSEGVAMPYALAGLWCAARAGRAQTAWPWEVVSALCVLVALGCKNTFAALIPAQVYLRMAANGPPTWAGLRRASLLALTLALPVGHYVYFRLHWHPGQYPPTGVTLAQIGREMSALAGAMSIAFMGIGVLLAFVAVALAKRSLAALAHANRSLTLAAPLRALTDANRSLTLAAPLRALTDANRSLTLAAPLRALTDANRSLTLAAPIRAASVSERVRAASVCEPAIRAASVSERAAWVTAALLVVCGIAVYAPMPAISGRYTMPAVWGLDIAFAGLLTKLAGVPLVAWRRSAVVGIAGGLVAVAIANVGRQDKFAARAALLWQALETVEWTAEPGERVAWVSGPALNVEEGIHFRWHLAARGNDTEVELIDATGTAVSRVELPAARGGATLAVTGTPNPPTNGAWALRDKFERRYWGGRRHYDCYLWTTAGAVARDGR